MTYDDGYGRTGNQCCCSPRECAAVDLLRRQQDKEKEHWYDVVTFRTALRGETLAKLLNEKLYDESKRVVSVSFVPVKGDDLDVIIVLEG